MSDIPGFCAKLCSVICLLGLWFVAGQAFATEKIDIRQLPVPAEVSILGVTATPETLARALVTEFGLSTEEGFVLMRESGTPSGMSYFHFNQVFQNVPVWGERVIVTRNTSNQIVRMNGTLMRGIAADVPDVTPAFDERAALNRAKDTVRREAGVAPAEIKNESARLVIFVRPSDNQARLSYEVTFYAVLNRETGEATRPVFIMDAKTGETLYHYENLQSGEGTGPGGNNKTGKYYYGPSGQFPPFEVGNGGNPWTSVSEGQTTPGAPVTAVPWGQRFALFVADPNGGVYTTGGDPQGGFGPWASVSEGRTTPGAWVTAVPWGQRFAVFVADPNGGVYTTGGDPQGGFGPWASVSEGGTTPGAPVTAVPWGQRIAVFVADPNGGVYTTGGDPQGGFGPWASVSEGRTTPGGWVTAVPWGQRIALFLADPNGGVYTTGGDPQGGFGPWASVSEGRATPGGRVIAVPWGQRFACLSLIPVAGSTRPEETPKQALGHGLACRRVGLRPARRLPQSLVDRVSPCLSPIPTAGSTRL